MTRVALHFYVLRLNRLPVARPARARMILRVGTEQWLPAADTYVRAFRIGILVFSAERWFGALLTSHMVLLFAQLRAPLRIVFL